MNPKSPDPHDDEHRAMREALQRDAARVSDEPFDATLHYATMRRVRNLGDANRARPGWPMVALGAACVVMLVMGVILVPWQSSPPEVAVTASRADPEARGPARGSAWSYQLAARQGDEALMAILDRDARDLLSPTASPFSAPLN